MSRRSSTGKGSPLDAAYDERGLLRPAEAARRLGVGVSGLGPVPVVTFKWHGKDMRGYRTEHIEVLHERLAKQQPAG